MKKTSKLGIVAATLAMALSCTTVLGVFAAGTTVKAPEKGFSDTDPIAIDISATNEALNHWMYYMYNTLEDGKPRDFVYEDPDIHFKVTENGRTGQAMWVDRDTADGEFLAYSYYFDVLPNQDYVVTAYVKSVCETSNDNKVSFMIEQRDDNGTDILGDAKHNALATVSGRRDDWSKTQFSFKTDATCTKLSLKIKVLGLGDFYIDDITVQTSNAGTNSDLYKMAGVGNDGSEDPADMPVLTTANISSDSSDGDGKSLKLGNGDVYKTVFGVLPHNGNYTLSFKYKNTGAGTADRLSIRMDNENTSGACYADGVSSTAGVADEEWQTYKFDFVSGQRDICWMGITAYGGYLIDELSITGTDDDGNTMQYIVNGSFSGAYVEGYSLFQNFSVAKQTDETYVFASSSVTKDSASGQRGYMRFDTTTLEQGKTYTLSFDYRSGGGQAVYIAYGTYWNDQIDLGICDSYTAAGWSSQSFTFVAGTEVTDKGDKTTKRIATTIELYGDSGIGWPTYLRNISIKDAEGNDYVTSNKTLVAPEVVLGDNIFEWGTFEGDREYKATDWTFEGKAGIYGLVFDTRFETNVPTDTKPDYKVCLEGAEGAPASAISKAITVEQRTLALGYKYYGGNPANLVVSALFGENQEVFMDENGFIELPEGVTTIQLKFTSEKYFSFKYLNVLQHTHITPAEEDITTVIATCTNAGGKSFYCTDCEKTVYIERTPQLDHTLKHVHVDATCKDGVDMDVCEVCNQEFNKTVLKGDPANHEWEEVIIKQPTCKENGMKEKVCKHCQEKSDPSIIPATNHNYENGECTVCHEKDPDYKPDSSSAGTEDSGKDSGTDSGKTEESGCGSSISGGFAVLGLLAAAAYVTVRRKKD